MICFGLRIEYSVQRIAYKKTRLRERLRHDELGLIGFVFSRWSGRFFVVIGCWDGSCVGSRRAGIGFVLHINAVISWQDGLCGGLRKAQGGFGMRRDVRFAGIVVSILITSNCLMCIIPQVWFCVK